MIIEKEKLYAVITGDIVKSSKLSIEKHNHVIDTLHDIIKHLPQMQMPHAKEEIQWIGPSISQGDTWQVLTNLPAYALLTALYINACLMTKMNVTTRISIGIGAVEYLPGVNLSQARGDAFSYSGRGLSLLRNKEYIACWFVPPIKQPVRKKINNMDYHNLFLNTSLLFTGRITNEWSQLEAFVVSNTIQGMKQDKIAVHWPDGASTQQNVGKTLHRAGWIEIEKVIHLFQAYILQLQPK